MDIKIIIIAVHKAKRSQKHERESKQIITHLQAYTCIYLFFQYRHPDKMVCIRSGYVLGFSAFCRRQPDGMCVFKTNNSRLHQPWRLANLTTIILISIDNSPLL